MFSRWTCILPFFTTAISAVNLFVSHYTGNVSTLTLSEYPNGTYALTLNTTLETCGLLPSWLTFNSTSRTLYCSDETSPGNGSLTTYSVPSNGSLIPVTKVETMGGGVASTLYGDGYIAIAHYETSSISTFKLPLTASSTAQQVFTYKLTAPGTIPARQDAPHPHDVIVDPTGAYIIAPDLGADLIHIFSIDPTSGHLTECPSYITPGGTGPRHGAFTLRQDRPRRNAYVGQQLYVSNELANTVTLYNVEYPRSHCLTLSPVQVATTYPSNKTAATGITVAEVRLSGDFLYVSNRNDLYFSPDDSVTAFSINSQAPTGDITFLNITSSGGWYPRTFVVNKAGTFVAVGDQTSSNVAIFKRDRATGLLGTQVGNLRVGPAGTVGDNNGLSSVIWDE